MTFEYQSFCCIII